VKRIGKGVLRRTGRASMRIGDVVTLPPLDVWVQASFDAARDAGGVSGELRSAPARTQVQFLKTGCVGV
jgi:hypothetical protein